MSHHPSHATLLIACHLEEVAGVVGGLWQQRTWFVLRKRRAQVRFDMLSSAAGAPATRRQMRIRAPRASHMRGVTEYGGAADVAGRHRASVRQLLSLTGALG